MNIDYHAKESCNKCGGENGIEVSATDEGYISECYTTCIHCGHEDYWSNGFFQSSQDGLNNCEKYQLEQPK